MRAPQAQVNSRERTKAFSLIELLVVMAIIGILAAIGLPALRGLGGSNDISAANRQLLDDLSYARFKAINDRTTVYVVFASHDILNNVWNNLQRTEIAKLANLQYTSYALFAKRSLGDQPGPGTPRYITAWRTLPEGVFFPTNKFDIRSAQLPLAARAAIPLVTRPFAYEDIPFPAATDKAIKLPVIAFDYQGRLKQMEDVILPISKGSIVYPQQGQNSALVSTLDPPEVIETPKNNYTNNPVIRIDWLTGRSRSIRPENVDYAASR